MKLATESAVRICEKEYKFNYKVQKDLKKKIEKVYWKKNIM